MNDNPAERRLRVAALGDIHVKEGQQSPYQDLFAEISRDADVMVLCGDLTDLGKPVEAEILAHSLRSCSVPIVAVLGNHDYESGRVEEVKTILRQAKVTVLEGQSVTIHDVGFVGTKGFAGGFGRRMLSSFGEPAIKAFVHETVQECLALETAMRRVGSKRSMVVLHYAPIAATVAGEPDEILPFLGCSRLAETIDRFQVDAVVHGHAHRGVFEGRTPGGNRVFNVAFAIEKPGGKPYALLEI